MLNDINGYTRTCGLIGNPVEHTLSPVIHNTLSMVLGENLAYVPFHVENGRLEDAVKGAFALNLLGLNVTVPYKSDIIQHFTFLSGGILYGRKTAQFFLNISSVRSGSLP